MLFDPPVRLTKYHKVDTFDCGKPPLNEYLRKHARQSQQGRGAVTYVVVEEDRVLAYYSVSLGSVRPEHAPERVAKGMGKYDIPILLLARLAIDITVQGQGLGGCLLLDCLRRACNIAEEAGCRAVVVDAIDDSARDFYQKYGFEASELDEFRLFLMIKDIKRTFGL